MIFNRLLLLFFLNSAVTKWDLNKHIQNVHKNDTYYCEECNFTCQKINQLRSHMNNEHVDVINIYQCHCCMQEYRSGGTLSRHLIKKHGFQLPSGHVRFTYQQGTDGIYRVQTTRIESLEVSEQIMATPATDQTNTEKTTYVLNDVKKTEIGYTISIGASTSVKKDEEMEKSNQQIDIVDSSSDNSIDMQQENTFKGKFESQNMPEMNDSISTSTDFNTESNIDETNQTELKSIDDFSVMKKYLKKKNTKNKIIIMVDEVDEQGKLIRRETRNANEYHL